MPTTSYKLGRDAVCTLTGVTNDDVKSVTINAAATQLDVTTFKATPLTSWAYMAGLIDATIDVTCVAHTASVSDRAAATIAGITGLDAVVLEIRENVTPKGMLEYTISYGLIPSDVD